MDLTRFVTRAEATSDRYYIEGSENRWWIQVRALNNREKKMREQIAYRERRFVPVDKNTREEHKKKQYEETAIEFQMAEMRAFEYERCIEDFTLPYMPKGVDNFVDIRKNSLDSGELRKFYDHMPPALAEFVEDSIAKSNKEDEASAKEAEETKNA